MLQVEFEHYREKEYAFPSELDNVNIYFIFLEYNSRNPLEATQVVVQANV